MVREQLSTNIASCPLKSKSGLNYRAALVPRGSLFSKVRHLDKGPLSPQGLEESSPLLKAVIFLISGRRNLWPFLGGVIDPLRTIGILILAELALVSGKMLWLGCSQP